MMNPVTLDICWSRRIGVVNEQAAALMRTSCTSIVREAGDLSAGVFDRRGFMVDAYASSVLESERNLLEGPSAPCCSPLRSGGSSSGHRPRERRPRGQWPRANCR